MGGDIEPAPALLAHDDPRMISVRGPIRRALRSRTA